MLVGEIGLDLSLSPIIVAILDREKSWHAFSSFYEKVMLQKKEAEKFQRSIVSCLTLPATTAGGTGSSKEEEVVETTTLPPHRWIMDGSFVLG